MSDLLGKRHAEIKKEGGRFVTSREAGFLAKLAAVDEARDGNAEAEAVADVWILSCCAK